MKKFLFHAKAALLIVIIFALAVGFVKTTVKAEAALTKPVIVAQTATYKKIKVTVTSDIDEATGYKYYRSTTQTGGYKLIRTTSSSHYYDDNLKTGTRYYYKVIAYHGAVNSSASNPRSAKPVLNDIANINQYPRLRTIILKWTDISGASGYKVYRASSPNGTYKHIVNTSDNSYTNGGLSNGEDYWYRIKPYRQMKSGVAYGSISAKKQAVTPIEADRYKIKKTGWLVLETNGDAYWEICYYSSCDWGNGYDENDLFDNKAYVYVESGDYLSFETYGRKGSIKRLEYYDDISQKTSLSEPGYYLVGLDLKPGEYRLASSEWYYYSVCLSFVCDWGNGYDDNDLLTSGGTSYVQLQHLDFLIISGDRVKGVRVN